MTQRVQEITILKQIGKYDLITTENLTELEPEEEEGSGQTGRQVWVK